LNSRRYFAGGRLASLYGNSLVGVAFRASSKVAAPWGRVDLNAAASDTATQELR
jgi:hypothetical protein